MADDKVLKLSRPVKDIHDAKVTELKLRRPTGREVFEIGVLPFTVGADDSFAFTFPVVRSYLLRLSGQGGDVIDALDVSDLMAAATWLSSCFNTTGDDLGNSDAPAKP